MTRTPVPAMLNAAGAHGGNEPYIVRRTPVWWRVLIGDDGRFVMNGDTPVTIVRRLRVALRAPDGRVIPIHGADLLVWLDAFFVISDAPSRRGHRVLYMKDPRPRLPWAGTRLRNLRLPPGAWWLVATDGSETLIPQTHTAPLRALQFDLTDGVVRASVKTKAPDLSGDSVEGSTSH